MTPAQHMCRAPEERARTHHLTAVYCTSDGDTEHRVQRTGHSTSQRRERSKVFARILKLDAKRVGDAAQHKLLVLAAEHRDGARPLVAATAACGVQVRIGRLGHVKEIDVRAVGDVEAARAERRRQQQPLPPLAQRAHG
eukprot:1177215-Prymnesium_polylepis.1